MKSDASSNNSSNSSGDESNDGVDMTQIRYTTTTDENSQRRRRQGHVMVLLPLTTIHDDTRELVEFRLYVEMAAFLAFTHLQTRDGSVLPFLPDRLQGCDFDLTYRHHDTRFSAIQASRQVVSSYQNTIAEQDDDNSTTTDTPPFCILGAARSVVSQAVSYLGSGLELPQVSSSSTASSLDDSPFFARTVPVTGDAEAMVYYMRQVFGVTHVGLLFIDDTWGRRYETDITVAAEKYNMTVRTVPFANALENRDATVILDNAMRQLQQTQLRYFIAALSPSTWRPVVKAAYHYQLMGSTHPTTTSDSSDAEYVWLLPDLVELVGDSFSLDADTELDIANALHGVGVVNMGMTPHSVLDAKLADASHNPQFQQDFIRHHDEPQLLQDFNFSTPIRSLYQYLTYDAMMAIGITACETPGLFTGQQFYNQLLQIDFEGVTGRVLLDPKTGTRAGADLQFPIVNLILQHNATQKGRISFTPQVAAQVDLLTSSTTPVIQIFHPFLHSNNSTQPPPSLPPLHVNRHLIPNGVLFFGIALAIVVMLLSVGLGIWVLANKSLYIIRVGQPIFLVQLCFGTFLVALTIIPLGWQEDKPGLDAACMAVPWLFCIGYAIAVSALWSKAERINQLLNSGRSFRRLNVQPKDVMKSTLILLGTNLILLTAWTISPWKLSWHRQNLSGNNVDSFGRALESYGACRPDSLLHLCFTVPLILTNLVALLMTTYHTYRARNLPMEFSETLYLFMSLISVCETILLGVPIIFVVFGNPSAYYLIASIVLSIGCLAIIVPMFLPKYLQRHTKAPKGRASSQDLSRLQARSGLGSEASEHQRRQQSGTRFVAILGDKNGSSREIDSLRQELKLIRDGSKRGLDNSSNPEFPFMSKEHPVFSDELNTPSQH
ncbi:Gamma-aminobutyric acid (GABA) B receptor [Seminavis robusta]|uniref:Gamma-aminobutyric acid (GABA) B receptor n=1 Tax=Seminavis robusta TaxID=568900 RepID=A0A9N8DXJ9_9STRA|nr:Gamma-aminobutyric acid (GABA) B receptor [Seminavis robusta]|eukprot:Sro356_g125330.1 Gamma-aminobutyric acid (GABA) B receptor (890) ;mRNA; f:30393-33183